jgi:hypothetical protein
VANFEIDRVETWTTLKEYHKLPAEVAKLPGDEDDGNDVF